MRILIVEDEIRLAEALQRLVQDEQYQTDLSTQGEDAYELARTIPYDAIVMDWMLPGMTGLEIVKSLRQQGISTPVLLLTARDTVKDRVEGLNAGADDYLVKPFAMEELLARIKALVRRPSEFVADDILRYEDLQFDLTHRAIRCGEQEEIISPKEAQILEMLIRHPGQVLTRRQLIDGVWGYEADVLEGVLDTYVHHLRRRLSAIAGPGIHTLRGVGYSLQKHAGK